MYTPDAVMNDGSSRPVLKNNKTTATVYDCEIMQYTGLKDKTDVPIFEGDIIVIEPDESKEYANEPYHPIEYGDVCTVEWSNTNLAYYLMPVDEDKEERQMDYYGSWSGWNWIKVIGNLWESPGLLNA